MSVSAEQTLAIRRPDTAAGVIARAAGARHRLRKPVPEDGAAIHRLITQCPPLDRNSVYAYLLLCEHFRDTCVVAERDGKLDGFVSAYVPPGRDDVLFVWQVAVHARARGHRLGRAMLERLLERPGLAEITTLETTVGPDNQASRRMFAGLADSRGAACAESPLFERQLFGAASHDDEMLLRIGPFGPVP